MRNFAWLQAHSAKEAASWADSLVAEAMAGNVGGVPAFIKAGGIDLLDLMKEGLLAPQTLVNLHGVSGLDAIAVDEFGGARIGALATLAPIGADPRLRRWHPALADAAARSASPEIRNVATIGGNLLQRPRCWYFRAAEFHCLRKGGGHCFAISGENQHHAIFDNQMCAIVHPSTAATALIALGATLELENDGDEKRTVRLEDFLIGPSLDLQRENDLRPHEILTAVVLPPPPPGRRSAHLKTGEKDSFDWPLADVAVVIDLDADGACAAASIVLGAAAPTPHRSKSAEAALVGHRIDEGVARTAAGAAVGGATPLAKNAYKLPLFEALVRRAILEAVG